MQSATNLMSSVLYCHLVIKQSFYSLTLMALHFEMYLAILFLLLASLL